MGNKEPWQCSSMALCSSSGSSIEVSLLLKVMGAMLEGAAAALAPGKSKSNRMRRVPQPERCPQASRVCARTAGQQDAAKVAHPDQGQALCLSLVVLELPGTRQLGWVCAQHQGNKMCLSHSAAHQGWDMPVFGIGEQESCLGSQGD